MSSDYERKLERELRIARLERELAEEKEKRRKKPHPLSFDSDNPVLSIGAGIATGGMSWLIFGSDDD